MLDTLQKYNENNKRIIEFQKNEIEKLKEYILEPNKQEKMAEMKREIVNIKDKSKISENEVKKMKIGLENYKKKIFYNKRCL